MMMTVTDEMTEMIVVTGLHEMIGLVIVHNR